MTNQELEQHKSKWWEEWHRQPKRPEVTNPKQTAEIHYLKELANSKIKIVPGEYE